MSTVTGPLAPWPAGRVPGFIDLVDHRLVRLGLGLLFPFRQIVWIVGDLLEPLERAAPGLEIGHFPLDALVLQGLHQEQPRNNPGPTADPLSRQGLGQVENPGGEIKDDPIELVGLFGSRWSPVRKTPGSRRHRENRGRLATVELLPDLCK